MHYFAHHTAAHTASIQLLAGILIVGILLAIVIYVKGARNES